MDWSQVFQEMNIFSVETPKAEEVNLDVFIDHEDGDELEAFLYDEFDEAYLEVNKNILII